MLELDKLFGSVIITEDDVQDAIDDDWEEFIQGQIAENKKIDIFGTDFILEGEE